MAYNEYLADKIRKTLKERKVSFVEKKMMGGLCVMVDDKMCVGVIKDDLMGRVGPHVYEDFLKRPGASVMDFTKKPMKGYLYLNPEGWDIDETLEEWIDQCLIFNKEARSSKKR